MQFSNIQSSIKIILGLLLTSLILNSCDSNENKSRNAFTVQQKEQKYSKDTTLKGKVSSKRGNIVSGEIKATNLEGTVLVTAQLQNNYHYAITIPAGTKLPLELHFYPKTRNAYIKKMTSAIIYPNIKTYDINELTTSIAKRAKALGGYTHAHMVSAAESTVSVPDANKTTAGFRGDPTKQYGGWH